MGVYRKVLGDSFESPNQFLFLFCSKKDPPRGRIAFYCKLRVLLVNKILIGFENHPVGFALFQTAHGMRTEAFDIAETGPLQPVMHACRCGDKPGSRHLGIGFFREQGHGFFTGNGLGFQQETAARLQGSEQITQGINGGRAVIEDTQAENDIKAGGEQGQVLDSQEVNIEVVQPGKTVQGLEGVIMMDIGLKAQHQLWGLSCHAEHVITIIAADIRHHLVFEIRHLGQEAIPFAPALPFRINCYIKNRKRTFAPRHEALQKLENLIMFLVAEILSPADPYGITGQIKGGGPEMIRCLHGFAVTEKALLGLIDPGLLFCVDLLHRILEGIREKFQVGGRVVHAL